MYRLLFNLILKRLDPEFAHSLGVIGIRILAALFPQRIQGRAREVAGIRFENAIGMAAGFDKNGKLIGQLYQLGFGHVEVGTVTPVAQPGNPKPRLFRLAEHRALINRMGFNNEGADALAARLKRLRSSGKKLPVIGVNIGKNKQTSAEMAASDYAVCAKKLASLADYLVVNVSSPNTPGLRDLQQVTALRPILEATKKHAGATPIFLKIAPDMDNSDLEAVVALATELELSGLIVANTTISREGISGPHVQETGGLSGAPLAPRAIELLEKVRALSKSLAIISVGGAESASDVRARLAAGADLVQGYTGFVYHGPFWARALSRGDLQGS
ncbi:MAG: quinone-dependent dihydroorotate dehydrogenase [Aquiluna sp.]